MEPKDLTILLWDDPENFNKPETQRMLGLSRNNKVYKNVIQFYDYNEFKEKYNSIDDSEELIFCCHVAYKDFSVYQEFQNSRIREEFGIEQIIYLSSADSGETQNKLFKKYTVSERIITYNKIIDLIRLGDIKPFNKSDIEKIKKVEKTSRIEYGLITALYDNEFEEIENHFEFNEESKYLTEKKVYNVGYFKANRDLKITATALSNTGMVDAAIISTQMLELFKPNLLIMSGVCGSHELKFGDIVIAKSIFTFQKGKMSNDDVPKPSENSVFFDIDKNPIDLQKVYDSNGRNININFEKFEVEHDSIIEIDSLIFDTLRPNIRKIKQAINNDLKKIENPLRNEINIIFAPMACSTMVINKADYFKEKIKTIDRNAAAVEMESYGIARATQFANNGNTKWLIFKSVMDNTYNKNDDAKQFAAKISALFLKYLFEYNIF